MISFSSLLAAIYFTECSDSGVRVAFTERQGAKCAHYTFSRLHSLLVM